MKLINIAPAIFFVFAACSNEKPAAKSEPAPAVSKETRLAAIAHLESKPAWLPAISVDVCPVDVMTKDLAMRPFTPNACKGDLFFGCVEKCRLGDGVSCYASAVELQSPGPPQELVEALFLRGCMQGDPGSCTQRTTGRLSMRDNAVDDCTLRSFRRLCAAQDPWACAMLASSLLQLGHSEEIQSAIDSACRIAPGLDPCVAAKSAIALKRAEPASP
jgi:hypothetical protein